MSWQPLISYSTKSRLLTGDNAFPNYIKLGVATVATSAARSHTRGLPLFRSVVEIKSPPRLRNQGSCWVRACDYSSRHSYGLITTISLAKSSMFTCVNDRI